MNLLIRLKFHALASLARMHGQPMPDSTLRDSLRIGFRHERITETQIEQAIRALDSEGNLTGLADELTGQILWSLTPKGHASATRA